MTSFSRPASAFGGCGHEHEHCVESALHSAESLCQARGARLTPLRRQVLELIWADHAPLGAYDILDKLATLQGRVAPPTVYRTLDFLVSHGLVHRIESLNAYIGCAHPEETHKGQFLICRKCGTAAEIDDPRIAQALRQSAKQLGFRIEHETVELRGLCPACLGESPTDAQTAEIKESEAS